MSVNKANRFIRTAKSGGWTTRYKILNADDAAIQVVAKRGPETVTIEWHDNYLSGSPIYELHDMRLKIHSRKDAERILVRPKPDMERYRKWQQRNRHKAPAPGQAPGASMGEPDSAISEDQLREMYADSLPFDIKEDPDSVILKAVRGSTIIFRNSVSGLVESEFVPFKVSDGKVFNYDTENVFYLAENEEGRAFISFMNSNGCFRAVHLDRILAVV